jgi:hypothetical protein
MERMLMKKFILTVMFMAALAATAFAKDPPETILQSLPTQFKSFTAEEPFLYNDKRLGASIGYNDQAGTAITVYLYDLGAGDIETGAGSQIVKMAKEGAIADIKQAEQMGYYSNFNIVSDKQMDFDIGEGKSLQILFVSCTYEFTNELTGIKQQVASSIYLTGLKGYICKIRVSRPADMDKDREEGIRDILRILLLDLQGYESPSVQPQS